MAQDDNFVTYLLEQLGQAAAQLRLPCSHQRHFNAVSFSLAGQPVALIVNNTLFVHIADKLVNRLLPDAKPFQPAGVNVNSQFYPVPLAWLADVARLAECLASAVEDCPAEKATA
ncbi:hypothetical protein L1F30_00185 [Simiduia sp. 21SJ11W-1]|uniref:hypothetical protein n=1 Tax=Simiduia sp. 21SJ11W-1 TaxID=2909669 RepID=UPI0020A1A578|nr:hypothetical protein [Simiduia sp. 21SJ11W-1]UTA47974.1 hypothetical protein L1F30_00185 [Simiduia sp. 21SJ11W-1]